MTLSTATGRRSRPRPPPALQLLIACIEPILRLFRGPCTAKRFRRIHPHIVQFISISYCFGVRALLLEVSHTKVDIVCRKS